MKRYGICYASKVLREIYQEWDYFHCHADNEQQAVDKLFVALLPGVIVCIANVVEWKGDPNGQYILTAA